MKNKIIFFVMILSSIFLSRCIIEPNDWTTNHYYIYNTLPHEIIYVDKDSSQISIKPFEKTLIHTQNFENVYSSSSFSDLNDSPFIDINFGAIIFNDSISIQYSSEDVFSKTPIFCSFWKIIDKQKVSRYWYNYEVEYTVDEEDYRNALAQSGL